ncbi:MAG: AAA family ATPase [Chloroflexota bacterium]
MTLSIAVAGKGGTGKTTVAALLIELLSRKGTVLAIDADPSTNLPLALGLSLGETVGQAREEMLTLVKGGKFSPSLPKQDYLELKVREALSESPGIDLLAMGRPEGPGCYCAANNMLRQIIDRLGSHYDYVVIDCEAGMEHLSRQTTRDIDLLLLVSDPTVKGVYTARKMKELIRELRTSVGRVALVLNRVKGPISAEISQVIEEGGLELVQRLPEDPALADLEARGQPVKELPPDSPLRLGVEELARKLLPAR